MDSPNEFQWPVEMLCRILHFLSMDGATATWKKLAYLTDKNHELKTAAIKMQRPLVLRVGFDGQGKGKFVFPFQKATVAHIEIDWGDDTTTQVIHSEEGDVVIHEYKDLSREYTVRVFPHGRPGLNGIWLDHLGWDSNLWYNEDMYPYWSRPLRSLDSLGNLGITSIKALFFCASEFNLPLNHLDVSGVQNMAHTFQYALAFNQPLNRWDVSSVKKMNFMFCTAKAFNQSLAAWNVSLVVRMQYMFHEAESFNQPIGDWNTSKVQDMRFMFSRAEAFNQDISGWNVSNVTNMKGMFSRGKAFNQPIGSWNVAKVEDMKLMFFDALEFNQDVGAWKVANTAKTDDMFLGAIKFDRACIASWNLQS